jgi:hypothetical protein
MCKGRELLLKCTGQLLVDVCIVLDTAFDGRTSWLSGPDHLDHVTIVDPLLITIRQPSVSSAAGEARRFVFVATGESDVETEETYLFRGIVPKPITT